MASDIGPRIGIDGEAEYRKQIQNIIQQAKTLDSEMKLVASSFTKSTTAQEKNKATAKVLTQQVEVQQKRVEELNAMLEKCAKEFGDTDTKTLKWKETVNKATAELNQLEGQLVDVNSYSEKTGKSLESAGRGAATFGDILKANLLTDAITSGMRALANAAMDAARAFFEFAKDGVETASNLQEVQNVVDVTFGDSTGTVDKFAKSAAGAFGMSELSAKKYTGTMGAMLKSMGLADDEVLNMSTSLAGLAGDLASFYNLDTEEAFAKIRSGISGETEPLKQLGINMSVANMEAYALTQGIEKQWKEMTQAEQTALRYSYLMQATADAQGDFARTSESFANQSRILQLNMENLGSAIGQKILPVINGFAKALNGLIGGSTNMGGFINQISAVVTDAATKIREKLPELIKTGGEMLNAIMQGITDLLPELAAIVIPLVTALAEGLIEGLPMLVEMGGTLILELGKGIAEAAPELIRAATDTIITLTEMLTKPDNIRAILETGIDLLMALAEGLLEAIPRLLEQIPVIIDNVVTALLDNLELLITAGIELSIAVGVGMIEAIPKIVSMLPDIFKAIFEAFSNVDWKELGVNIIKGLINGLHSMLSSLWNSIKEIASGIVSRAKAALDINSPSGIFDREIGRMIPPGITVGVEKAMPSAVRDMKAQFAALPGLSSPQGVTRNTNYGGVSINVYGAPGQDVNALADAIMHKIYSAVARREAVYA